MSIEQIFLKLSRTQAQVSGPGAESELPMMSRVDLHSQVLLFLTAVCTTAHNSCVSVQASA